MTQVRAVAGFLLAAAEAMTFWRLTGVTSADGVRVRPRVRADGGDDGGDDDDLMALISINVTKQTSCETDDPPTGLTNPPRYATL